MSIQATAVVRKETKVDPKKPNEKAYYALCRYSMKKTGEYGLPCYFGEFRHIAVLLKREVGVHNPRPYYLEFAAVGMHQMS
jgi:hypothetical protein